MMMSLMQLPAAVATVLLQGTAAGLLTAIHTIVSADSAEPAGRAIIITAFAILAATVRIIIRSEIYRTYSSDTDVVLS